MRRAWLMAATAACVFLGAAGAASAGTTVFGNGFAAECSRAATLAARSQRPTADAFDACNLALDHDVLSAHETAATHVNRGVLYLTRLEYGPALADFDRAAQIEPGLGEAYVNRGAALIAMDQNREGVADINKGLALNAEEPEKAYFNRAVAEERLDDVKSAYFDFLKASELKPDWDLPKAELVRFTVTRP